MTEKKREDSPFLTKFNRKSIYMDSYDDVCLSVVQEIGNILSTKLRTIEYYFEHEEGPFSYGVRDLPSIGVSSAERKNFEEHCKRQILKFEPRISDIIVAESVFNDNTQSLEMTITCELKCGERFTTKIESVY